MTVPVASSSKTIPEFSLQGKVAVVTGGSRGLGLTMARAMAESGADIAVLDVLPASDALWSLKELGVRVKYHKCDVTDAEQVESALASIASMLGGIHVCLAAAGIVREKPFLEHSLADFQVQLQVNTVGTWLVAQGCAKHMAQQGTGGSIIFIASITSHQGAPQQRIAGYCASKAAVRGLVKPLAMELAQHNIRVNSISPGYMMTDMTKALGEQNPQLIAAFQKEGLFGRMGLPEELRGPIVYLASDASSYQTGQDILVDGGVSCW